jgi:hypothetical protein
MKLKEKFKIINCKDCDIPYCDTKCTILAPSELIKLEQISDEFAIGFGEWLVIRYNEDIIFDEYTTKELLEIYKKEKVL